MKHEVPPQLLGELLDLAAEAGVKLEEPQGIMLIRYMNAMLKANEVLNLTRITDVHESLRLHLLDSLTALPEVSSAPRGPAIDLGSGAGFPGVPLAVASGRFFVLLDSVRKKTQAVSAALGAAGIPNTVARAESGRAESYAIEHCEAYAIVTARAVASLPALVELASPLLRKGGLLIALKGCPDPTEQASGARCAQEVGMRLRSCRETTLPVCGEHRTLLTYEKIGRPRVVLPRRVGLAQHSPLA